MQEIIEHWKALVLSPAKGGIKLQWFPGPASFFFPLPLPSLSANWQRRVFTPNSCLLFEWSQFLIPHMTAIRGCCSGNVSSIKTKPLAQRSVWEGSVRNLCFQILSFLWRHFSAGYQTRHYPFNGQTVGQLRQEGVQERRWSPASPTGSHGRHGQQTLHPAPGLRMCPGWGDTLGAGLSTPGEELLHSVTAKNKTAHALWVDFSKAFDVVSHVQKFQYYKPHHFD